MILQSDAPKALADAWARAHSMLNQQAEEISPALRAELQRFLREAEKGLLHGRGIDLDRMLKDHERRIATLMAEGMRRTATAFAGNVLGDLDQPRDVGKWLRSAGAATVAATWAREGAERFARWTGSHLRKITGLRGDLLERELRRQRGTDAPRRAWNAAEDRAHLASQWATDSAALFSGKVDARVWLSRLDGRERPTHNTAHAQHCPMSGSFLVGGYQLRFPRDPRGPIHEIANCRCMTALRRKS